MRAWFDDIRRHPIFFTLLLAAASLTVAFIVGQGYELAPDTKGYLRGRIQRTPLYPLILSFFGAWAGEHHLRVVVAFQAVVGVASVMFFSLFMRWRFHLRSGVVFTMAALLAIPFFTDRIANMILTESIAYSFFLAFSSLFIRGLVDLRDRDLIVSFILVDALILTRPQFLFLGPLMLVAVIYVCARRRDLRSNLALTLALMVILPLAPLLDRTYRYSKFGHFEGPSLSGLQLLTVALYTAKAEDRRLFAEREAATFRRIYRTCRARRLLREDNPREGGLLIPMDHFDKVYNIILWRVARPALMEEYYGDDFHAYLFEEKAIAMTMSRRLIADNSSDYILLYVSNSVGRMPLAQILLLLLGATLGPYCARKGNPAGIAVAVAFLLHAGNCAAVALVQSVIARYSFYTETLYNAVFVVLIVSLAQQTRGRSCM